MKTSKPKLDIYLPEYEKIFRILDGTLNYANPGRPPSCLFFNVVGALILNKVYQVEARPRMGTAFINVNTDQGAVIAFANMTGSQLEKPSSHEEAFHCWIETEHHYIDFTAPVYSKYPNSFHTPAYMFQKTKALMALSHEYLLKQGDFYLQPNVELTRDRLASGLDSTRLMDFAQISLTWAENSKSKLMPKMLIQASDGERIELKLSDTRVIGAW
jgi:hypothetical protein